MRSLILLCELELLFDLLQVQLLAEEMKLDEILALLCILAVKEEVRVD